MLNFYSSFLPSEFYHRSVLQRTGWKLRLDSDSLDSRKWQEYLVTHLRPGSSIDITPLSLLTLGY